MTLYNYQKKDYKSISQTLAEGNSIMYQLPTGGGKTRVISEIVSEYSDKNVLILAHRRELLFQMKDTLSKKGINPGILVGWVEENLDSNILIGSVSTLSRDNRLKLDFLNKKWDLIIIDEAHRVRTPSYDKLLNHLKEINPKILFFGATATPYRYDRKDFREYFSRLLKGKTVKELIDEGYLSKYKTYITSIGDIDLEVEKSGEDYNISQLSLYMRKPELIEHGISQYQKYGEDRQCLIYVVDNKHLQSVVDTLKSKNYNSVEYITSDTPLDKREQILVDFKSNKLQFLISIGTLTEGTDLPDAGVLISLRPTDSLVLFHQILGRVMRKSSDGKEAIILDCSGLTKKFGLVDSVRDWSLDPFIDPKSTNKRSRVVAKRKDGSYTDSIDEIEIGDLEVKEMSPEEYILHSSNTIEEAEELNKKLKLKVEEEGDRFRNVLLKLLEDILRSCSNIQPNFEPLKLQGNSYSLDSFDFNLPPFLGYPEKEFNNRVTIRHQYGLFIPYIDTWGFNSVRDEKSVERILKLKILEGELSTQLIKQKDNFISKYKESQSKVLELNEQRIDVKVLREKKKEFRKEELEIQIQKILNSHPTVYFSKPIRNFTFRK